MASLKSKRIWRELGLYAEDDRTVGIANPPRFRGDADEVKWWDRVHDAMTDFAIEHGLSGRRPARGAARPTSLLLPAADLARARALAARRGLPYQTHLKMLLHEALSREARKAVA